jgi:hypothetical protein
MMGRAITAGKVIHPGACKKNESFRSEQNWAQRNRKVWRMFEAAREHSEKNVYTEYVDPKRDDWVTKIQPALSQAKGVSSYV